MGLFVNRSGFPELLYGLEALDLYPIYVLHLVLLGAGLVGRVTGVGVY